MELTIGGAHPSPPYVATKDPLWRFISSRLVSSSIPLHTGGCGGARTRTPVPTRFHDATIPRIVARCLARTRVPVEPVKASASIWIRRYVRHPGLLSQSCASAVTGVPGFLPRIPRIYRFADLLSSSAHGCGLTLPRFFPFSSTHPKSEPPFRGSAGAYGPTEGDAVTLSAEIEAPFLREPRGRTALCRQG